MQNQNRSTALGQVAVNVVTDGEIVLDLNLKDVADAEDSIDVVEAFRLLFIVWPTLSKEFVPGLKLDTARIILPNNRVNVIER